MRVWGFMELAGRKGTFFPRNGESDEKDNGKGHGRLALCSGTLSPKPNRD